MAEYYTDAISGERRERRKKRKVSRGPYSLAEKNMKRAFAEMVNVVMHRMDGELCDLACKEFTAWFVLSTQVMRRYSFDQLRDPQPSDWEELKEELGMARRRAPAEAEEFDVGNLMLLARVPDQAKRERLQLPGGSSEIERSFGMQSRLTRTRFPDRGSLDFRIRDHDGREH
jgi:hypothetical protein